MRENENPASHLSHKNQKTSPFERFSTVTLCKYHSGDFPRQSCQIRTPVNVPIFWSVPSRKDLTVFLAKPAFKVGHQATKRIESSRSFQKWTNVWTHPWSQDLIRKKIILAITFWFQYMWLSGTIIPNQSNGNIWWCTSISFCTSVNDHLKLRIVVQLACDTWK